MTAVLLRPSSSVQALRESSPSTKTVVLSSSQFYCSLAKVQTGVTHPLGRVSRKSRSLPSAKQLTLNQLVTRSLRGPELLATAYLSISRPVLVARSSGVSARLPMIWTRAMPRAEVELKERTAGRAAAPKTGRRKADMFDGLAGCGGWMGNDEAVGADLEKRVWNVYKVDFSLVSPEAFRAKVASRRFNSSRPKFSSAFDSSMRAHVARPGCMGSDKIRSPYARFVSGGLFSHHGVYSTWCPTLNLHSTCVLQTTPLVSNVRLNLTSYKLTSSKVRFSLFSSSISSSHQP